MEVKKIYRVEGSEETIHVNFEHNGQEAEFEYTLIGREIGIDNCSYNENKDEDIYAIIHDWIESHIETKTLVLFDGEKVNYDGVVLEK